LQTYLEQTKTKFSKDYKAMNPAKITTTVGLNSRLSVAELSELCNSQFFVVNLRLCFFLLLWLTYHTVISI